MAAISAHRGSCGTVGLPLRESYERAIALGVDYVEFDARRTLDGRYVVHHDPCLPGGRPIVSLTAAEFTHLAGDQALGMVELIELARGRVRLHVDLKSVGDEDDVLGLLRSRLEPDEFVVTTLEDASVAAVRTRHPEVRVGLSLGRDMAGLGGWRRFAVRLGELYPERRLAACRPCFLAVHFRLAEMRLLRLCRARGLDAWVWTVDEEPRLTRFLADPRTSVLITNRPDLALGR